MNIFRLWSGRWLPVFLVLAGWNWSCDALECQPVASLNYNLTEQWNHLPPQQSPVIFSIKRVESRQNFNVYMILRQVAVKDGNCKVLADLQISRPDGKLCFHGRDIVALSGKATDAAPTNSFLSPQFVKVRLEDEDPLGLYTIRLTATDQNSRQTATATAMIELVSSPEDFLALDFADSKAQQVITYYYLQPQPEKLIPLFLGYCKQYRDTLRQNKNHNPMTVLAFFYQALALNRQLVPQLAVASKELDPVGKNFTIMLFYYLGVTDQRYYDEIGKAQSAGFRKILAEQPNPFEFDFPIMPLQLDILWSKFFAAGELQTVKTVVAAIAEIQRGITPEQFKAIAKPTPAEQMKLSHWLVGDAAKWSLGANARQHPLVRAYLENLAESPELKNPFIKKQLQEILASLPKQSAKTP